MNMSSRVARPLHLNQFFILKIQVLRPLHFQLFEASLIEKLPPKTSLSCQTRDRNVYNTQLSGGIAWGDMWDMFTFKLYAAWEVNGWYNLAEHYRTSITDTDESDINISKVRTLTTSTFSTQGLTLGLMLDF
jgi:hypothetical protein